MTEVKVGEAAKKMRRPGRIDIDQVGGGRVEVNRAVGRRRVRQKITDKPSDQRFHPIEIPHKSQRETY